MTFYIDKETEAEFDFDTEAVAKLIMNTVLNQEKCQFSCVINLLITDNEHIRRYNREYRDIDADTDVLSFPNVDYAEPADFLSIEDQSPAYFDLESGELILGDIILSAERVKSQALEYGHSEKREFAFLVAHSMLHLCGYDHIEDEERELMEERQRMVMEAADILR